PNRRTITIIKGEAYEESEEAHNELENEELEPVYDEELVVVLIMVSH
ncbi:hypothetical protein A2U01_0097495, partial [Trifolium medium]|nr:hypothetical protein [Trifolium medium]